MIDSDVIQFYVDIIKFELIFNVHFQISTMNKNCKSTQKLNSKGNRKKSQSQSKNKAEQFYHIIEQFHNTLCILPLDNLVSSYNPQKWLAEQFQTYDKLCLKIITFQFHKNNPYYIAKLQSIAKILNNVSENMKILTKMKDYNYYSGAQSSRSSQRSQSYKQQYQNSNMRDLAKGLLSFDKYEIRSLVNTENQDQIFKDQQFQSSEELNNICQEQNIKYQQSINNLTKRNNNDSRKRMVFNTVQTATKTNSRLRQNTSQNYIQTVPLMPKSDLSFTLQKQQLILLKQQTEIYREQIQEMQRNFIEKDKIISKLLLTQQCYEKKIQVFEVQTNNQLLQNQFLAERINILECHNTEASVQIECCKKRQKDLMGIIKHQTQRNNNLEKAYDSLKKEISQKDLQIWNYQQNEQKMTIQINQVKKQQRLQKQKCEIYKIKYYQAIRNQKENNKNKGNSLKEINQKHRKEIQKYQNIQYSS